MCFFLIKIWMKMENDIGGVPQSVERDDSRHPENSKNMVLVNNCVGFLVLAVSEYCVYGTFRLHQHIC